MIDFESETSISAMMVHRPGGQLLLASSHGKGFVAAIDDLLAETRKGRQVVNLKEAPADRDPRDSPTHDHVACVGDNRKLVMFNLEELPILTAGRGCTCNVTAMAAWPMQSPLCWATG